MTKIWLMVVMAVRLDSFLTLVKLKTFCWSLVAIHNCGLLHRKAFQIDEAFNKESFGKIGSAGGKSQAISSKKGEAFLNLAEGNRELH